MTWTHYGTKPPKRQRRNTGPRHRDWCFTHNNPKDEDAGNLRAWVERDNVVYLCYGLERGESGTPHFQGYLELRHPATLDGLRTRIPLRGCHLEPRRGSQTQAIDYCRKDGEEGFTALGTPRPGQGARSDLSALKEDIEEGRSALELWQRNFSAMLRYRHGVEEYRRVFEASLPADPFQEKEVTWIFGPSGTGKTSFAVQAASRLASRRNVYVRPATTGGTDWFLGFRAEHTHVIIDEFRSDVKYTTLLRFLDGYQNEVETKGGSVPSQQVTHVWITSNYAPWEVYPKFDQPEQREPLYRRINRVLMIRTEHGACIREDRTNEIRK